MKHLLIFGAFALALGLQASAASPAPSPMTTPGYCGPTTDTAAVQNLWLAAHATKSGPNIPPLNVSYIMSIIVSGNYAQLMYQYAGQANAYYLKQGNTWRMVGNFAPQSFPKSVIAQFNGVTSENQKCANPHFVNHPSGR